MTTIFKLAVGGSAIIAGAMGFAVSTEPLMGSLEDDCCSRFTFEFCCDRWWTCSSAWPTCPTDDPGGKWYNWTNYDWGRRLNEKPGTEDALANQVALGKMG